MESDDDTFIFPPQEEPAHPPKLKRLRRVSSPLAHSIPPASPPMKTLKVDDLLKAGGESEVEVPVTVTSPSPGSDGLDSGGAAADEEDMLATAASPSPGSDGGMAADDGIDPLFERPGQFAGDDTSNLLWGVNEEGEGDDVVWKGEEGDWSCEVADGRQKKKSAKKRLKLDSDDGDDEENKSTKTKKKKKKVRSDKPENSDDRPAPSKNTLEKERKAHLEQLHAESQRLLRETRNASFKPVPVAQRPISTVLEKIRLRKLEMSKKSGNPSGTDSLSHADGLQKKNAELFDKTNGATSNADRSIAQEDPNSEKTDHMFKNSSSAEDVDSQNEDVGGSFGFSGSKGQEEETVNRHQSSSEKHVPSLLATNSNSDSDVPDDISSDEEDDDKENTDPREEKAVRLNLLKDDLAKSFMDDEAEEEDDSDHDLMRFPEDEEDDESEEHEELKDLIATVFEENHVDHEKRNQLHQKWLEQKDAEETENFLQRFEHYKKREHTIHDDEHTEETEEENGKDDYDTVQENSIRDITRKEKQKIALMFTEKDDEFVSSDDEETEERLSRQRLLEKTEEHATLLSPEEDGNSCQVFNLIKKLNIAPDPKKKIKPTRSSFDVSLLGRTENSSSKSFLGRMSANSMPVPCRPSSSCFKSFVFGRDDSNSRAGISSDGVPEINRAESQSSSSTRAKANSKYSSFMANNTVEMKTGGPSLFEILRKSSIQFDQQLKNTNERRGNTFSASQTTYQLQAFRLNKVVKKLPQES